VQRTQAGIFISWQAVEDSSGNPVAGYNIYRSSSPGGNYNKINIELITETEYLDSDPEGVSASSSGSSGGSIFYYGVASVDNSGDESAQTLGASAASIGTASGGGGGGGGGAAGGCFINTVNQSIPKQGLWLVMLLTIGVAVCYRHPRIKAGFHIYFYENYGVQQASGIRR
jgi:hypothetical protein